MAIPSSEIAAVPPSNIDPSPIAGEDSETPLALEEEEAVCYCDPRLHGYPADLKLGSTYDWPNCHAAAHRPACRCP
jgi:hypothetical protein